MIKTRGAKLPKYSFERRTHKKIMLASPPQGRNKMLHHMSPHHKKQTLYDYKVSTRLELCYSKSIPQTLLYSVSQIILFYGPFILNIVNSLKAPQVLKANCDKAHCYKATSIFCLGFLVSNVAWQAGAVGCPYENQSRDILPSSSLLSGASWVSTIVLRDLQDHRALAACTRLSFKSVWLQDTHSERICTGNN